MSQFRCFRKFKEFEVWRFTPDIIHPFPFYLEPITLTWRIRCIYEFFIGYHIYYIRVNDDWAGYCVISSGRNQRYKFSTKDDIIYGRYYICDKFRGKHLGLTMLHRVLHDCDILYKKAYAYLHCDNIASYKTMLMLGAKEKYRFDIKGFLRNKFEKNDDGKFVLFEYMPERGTT